MNPAVRAQVEADVRRRLGVDEDGVDAVREQVRQAMEYDRRAALYPGLARLLARVGFTSKRGPFFRFGEPPKGGRSHIVHDRYERGVSVFGGRRTRDGHFIIRLADPDMRVIILAAIEEGRPGYFVWGKRAGRGASTEPLVKVSRAEPIPDSCVVALEGDSRALDGWNLRRVGLLEEVPNLRGYFEEQGAA